MLYNESSLLRLRPGEEAVGLRLRKNETLVSCTAQELSCKMAQGGLLGPVHACSRLSRVRIGVAAAAPGLLSISARAAPTISAWAAPQLLPVLSRQLRRSYYLGVRGQRLLLYLGMRGLQLLSRHAGLSYYLSRHAGLQLLSQHAWAAATISVCTGCSYYLGMRGPQLLSRHGQQCGYLSVGCAAATISAWAALQLLSRPTRAAATVSA
jgi:hypothetical protein